MAFLKYFWNFHPENGGNDPIWRLHIFQMGWFNHQLELQLQKNFPLNNLTAIPLCSFIEVNPTNEHWKPMVFSDIFGGGSGRVLVAHQKREQTWPMKLDVISHDRGFTFHDWWPIFTYSWLKTSNPFQLQGNLKTQGNNPI